MFDIRFDNDYILEYNACTVSRVPATLTDGTPTEFFTITPMSTPLYIRINGGKPYVCTRPGERPTTDALTALLRVKSTSDLECYFIRYGYFFDIAEAVTIEARSLMRIVNRIRATVRLISSLYDNSVTNDECIRLNAYMILDDTRELPSVGYVPCNANLCDWIYHRATDIPVMERQSIVVDDAISQGNDLDYEEYLYIATHGTWGTAQPRVGLLDRQFFALTKLYTARLLCPDEQLMVDYAFRLQHDYDIISSCVAGVSFYTHNGINIRTPHILSSLDAVTRTVIVNEINPNLANVHFRYSPEMEPYGCYNDLLAALILCVYTTKPRNTIYRQCANHTCGVFFEVASSNGKKRYCSDACRKASDRRRQRARSRD